MSDLSGVSPPTPPTETLRSLLEGIRDQYADCARLEYTTGWRTYQDAVAALALLDAAKTRYRCGPGCDDCSLRDEPWRSTDVLVRLVPDPVGRPETGNNT